MKNIAVILAGGSGQRVGYTLPKQLLKIAGKRVLEHTLDVFENHTLIDEIVVVSNPDYMRDVEDIAIRGNYFKVKKILKGGEERYLSSLAAINAYDEEVNLIFHDAVRPLVNERIITDCINALERYNAVDVAVPTTDTIIQVDNSNEIVRIPSRVDLRNGQTPQCFKRSVIKKAYDIALKDMYFKTTDDCGVVLKYLPEEVIHVVKGEQFNIKLTYKEDLFLLDKLFQLKSISDITTSVIDDTQFPLKGRVMVVFGGSYGIGAEICNIAKAKELHVYSFSRGNGVDVSRREDVASALASVYAREGRIDFVVNTAGILQKMPIKNMGYDVIMQCVNVNYMGAVIVTKEAYPYLKETKGHLLLFASSSYTRGRSLYSLYSSSKAAIVNFVQAISEEWFDDEIRINCINPERTKTPMRVKNFGVEPDDTLLTAREVATVAITTLCTSLTGEVIDVKIKKNKEC